MDDKTEVTEMEAKQKEALVRFPIDWESIKRREAAVVRLRVRGTSDRTKQSLIALAHFNLDNK